MKRWLFLWVWFGVYSRAILHAAMPIDFGHFLESYDLQIDEQKTRELHPYNPNVPVDSYVVSDRFGNRYDLDLLAPEMAVNSIVHSQLYTLLDVGWVRPTFPILVKRGLHGVPTLEQSLHLKPGIPQKMLDHASSQEWKPALLLPIAHNYDHNFAKELYKGEIFSFEKIVNSVLARWIDYLFLNQPISPWPTTDGGFIFPTISTAIFRNNFYGKPIPKTFRDAFRLYPVPGFTIAELQKIAHDPFMREAFVARFHYFTMRLETLLLQNSGKTILDQILMPSLKVSGYMQPQQTIDRIKSRIATVKGEKVEHLFRNEIMEWLRGVDPKFAEVKFKEGRFGELKFNAYNLSQALEQGYQAGKADFLKGLSPREILFAYWMARSDLHPYFLKKIEAPEGKDPIEFLMKKAYREDPRKLVTHLGELRNERNRSIDIHKAKGVQSYLNTRRPKTLVVVAENDPEGREIAIATREMEKLLNQKEEVKILLYPNLPRVEHGERLTKSDITNIVNFAKDNQIKEIQLCELSEAAPQLAHLAEEAGIPFQFFDHHGKNWSPLSTFTQFTQFWGYRPSLYQMAVAAMDVEGIRGLDRLGVTRGEKETFIHSMDLSGLTRHFRDQITSAIYPQSLKDLEGALFVIRSPHHKAAIVDHALGWTFLGHAQPDSVTDVGSRLFLSGRASNVDALEKQLLELPHLHPLNGSDGGSIEYPYVPVGIDMNHRNGATFNTVVTHLKSKNAGRCTIIIHLTNL